MRLSGTSSRICAAALAVCALLAAGCETLQVPRIDPSGERIFIVPPVRTPPVYAPAAVPGAAVPSMSVSVAPREMVTPVGREVILLATVCDRGRASPKRRLEWSIAPGGVGHFVAVGRNTLIDRLAGDFNKTAKVDNTFAIGSTARGSFVLDRGTPTPGDDVCVQRGQGWVSITSPVEGTSRVTVYAPEVPHWETRTATAEIHWIDAEWQLPSPALGPAGSSQVLTTTVTRASDGSPRTGWVVRYEILDGPPAGFLPDLAQAVEVATDSSGRAGVEIAQEQPARGTNRIGVEILRPAGLAGAAGGRIVLAREVVLATWTGPGLAVRKSVPAEAGIGAPLTYRIEVSNPGDVPAEDVRVTDTLPEGLTFLESTPPARQSGATLEWSLGQMAPAASQTIELRCRAEVFGEVVNRVDAAAAGGLSASHTATTRVIAPKVEVRIDGPQQVAVGGQAKFLIEVRIDGPQQVAVGGQAKFLISITSRGQVPTGKLIIKDRLDPGFEHPVAVRGAIEREIESLAPGETQQVDVALTASRAGRLCHTVEVIGPEGVRAKAEACVTATGTAVGEPGLQPTTPPELEPSPSFEPSPQPSPPPFERPPSETLPPTEPSQPPGESVRPFTEPVQPPGEPQGRAAVSVRVTAPREVTEGEVARFFIDVTNTGEQTLTNVEVVNRYDPELSPSAASDEYRIRGTSLSWTLDRLAVGQTMPLELHCDCQRAAEAACNRVTVTSAEGAQAQGEACVKIRPAPGELSIAVADLRDPVAVKKGLTYEVRVTNRGRTSARSLALTATIPEGMIPDPIGTSGPPGVEYFIQGQTVQFKALGEIAPGESATYRLRVCALRPGKQTFHVELRSPALLAPLTEEEVTEVFE